VAGDSDGAKIFYRFKRNFKKAIKRFGSETGEYGK
jgi:hypothetical protein